MFRSTSNIINFSRRSIKVLTRQNAMNTTTRAFSSDDWRTIDPYNPTEETKHCVR